ncbi:hypothetical protein PH210_07630 [Paenibacillus sp. BSR1-1]|uniref:hypothetical protein n=1 Tax=Paenibacillus sp. BSR1-1 TaxID=3020845 RepID=UPI0025B23546|nr:hypothetical protein [Paenibacillus sp. BSR1-1]MDN3016078.1 hypothetical protein [Paenibacillus sp. BSR1-1]
MNTDQAFELLKNAGVPDDISIQTVKRWLRERKIKYEGKIGPRKTEYILDDTDQAINLLKDAGVSASAGLHVVQRWLNEGKIQRVGDRDQITDYISKETISPHVTRSSDQDKAIRDLQVKIKVQDDQLRGIEELHQTSIKTLIQQRDKLNRENSSLKNEINELQSETRKVLKENMELRNELLRLREELSKEGKREPEKTQTIVPPKNLDFRQKLGLSKTAGQKEVLAGFKKLLKITHPDQGGSAAAFHFVKADYDLYRKSIED